MQKHIFGIGSGKYHFDPETLDSFIEEARGRFTIPSGAFDRAAESDLPTESETQRVFDEIMSLHREYLRHQSFDVLFQLKTRLEEFSIRYHSHVLAAEVLNINSCLPYELRMAWSNDRRTRN
ncbi:hypothetical protein GMST_25050 [Geomonas silvestris]|uniref:Uncharacterized protein n=1 Tax=Geomonas silvestris TaxID=2740184 RepID=A0A6V8MJM2_9BACT|nr:hypothetical protein [Geomonas silvestris]GFO60180.1 hypothetical protein GMST_25050 [Geomonas silvestris]